MYCIFTFSLFYKTFEAFNNVSKMYLLCQAVVKLLKNCNYEKSRNPLLYRDLRDYFPQHCLYLRPEPHG